MRERKLQALIVMLRQLFCSLVSVINTYKSILGVQYHHYQRKYPDFFALITLFQVNTGGRRVSAELTFAIGKYPVTQMGLFVREWIRPKQQ